eukprot:768425-Hanusia_phi.AAC.3
MSRGYHIPTGHFLSTVDQQNDPQHKPGPLSDSRPEVRRDVTNFKLEIMDHRMQLDSESSTVRRSVTGRGPTGKVTGTVPLQRSRKPLNCHAVTRLPEFGPLLTADLVTVTLSPDRLRA